MDFPSELIKGQRINLQKPEKSFALAQVHNRAVKESLAELSPWLGWATADYSVEDSYEYLEHCLRTWNEKKEFNYIILNKNNELIGAISAMNVKEKDQSLEIGYWLSTPFTNRGLMQEAVRLLEAEFFNKGINRIVIHTDVLNLKSAHIPQKLGYCLEGIQREALWNKEEQKFRNLNTFSKLKSEYCSQFK